jgi:hypothetical protein
MNAMESGMMVVFMNDRLVGKNKIFMMAPFHRN